MLIDLFFEINEKHGTIGNFKQTGIIQSILNSSLSFGKSKWNLANIKK